MDIVTTGLLFGLIFGHNHHNEDRIAHEAAEQAAHMLDERVKAEEKRRRMIDIAVQDSLDSAERNRKRFEAALNSGEIPTLDNSMFEFDSDDTYKKHEKAYINSLTKEQQQ